MPLACFEAYVALISLHRGGPARITTAMGDPDSPIRSRCQTLAHATGRVVDRVSGDGALRDGVEPLQVCRLVGGVASASSTRPRCARSSVSSRTGWSASR